MRSASYDSYIARGTLVVLSVIVVELRGGIAQSKRTTSSQKEGTTNDGSVLLPNFLSVGGSFVFCAIAALF